MFTTAILTRIQAYPTNTFWPIIFGATIPLIANMACGPLPAVCDTDWPLFARLPGPRSLTAQRGAATPVRNRLLHGQRNYKDTNP